MINRHHFEEVPMLTIFTKISTISTISTITSGVADPGFGIEFEVVEFHERREVPLSPVTGENTIDDFPFRLVLEFLLSPAIQVPTVEKLNPTVDFI